MMEWKTVKIFATVRDNSGATKSFAAQVTLFGNDIENACAELSAEGFLVVSVHTFERDTLAAIILAKKAKVKWAQDCPDYMEAPKEMEEIHVPCDRKDKHVGCDTCVRTREETEKCSGYSKRKYPTDINGEPRDPTKEQTVEIKWEGICGRQEKYDLCDTCSLKREH